MTSIRNAAVSLDDIVDAALKAREFVEGLSFAEFEQDERSAFAVVRALEIVGEAAKGVPAVIRDRAPEVPWAEMAGMRDKLIHGYQGVDLHVVWRTVHEDPPAVIAAVRSLRMDVEKGTR